MRARSPRSALYRRTVWVRGIRTIIFLGTLATTLAPLTAQAHPQTRGGFYVGLDVARGSAAVTTSNVTSSREGGWGGGFRLGYGPNPKFALGVESNTWVDVAEGSAFTLGTVTAAVSVFPVEGLVLRGGVGMGDAAGAGDGLSGEVGNGWMLGAGYEFRVGRGFALGPQLHYNAVNLQGADFNFFNIGLATTWYFIPRE